ncbi:MAG TPA: type II secretion system protein GspC [Nannocystaceae bacterium]|nr:type II secretion system protein GspC [Nannocystaceae bacterium]
MLSLFGRRFWMIRLLGIATASAMAGSAASSALAFQIVDASTSFFSAGADTGDDEADEDEDEPLGPEVLANGPMKAGVPSKSQLGRKLAVEELKSNNPFCPTCRPADSTIAVMADGEPSPVALAPITKLPLELQATMEAENPANSLATIYDNERNIVGIYGRGDEIRPGVTLASVDLGVVQLRRGNGFERLEVGVAPEPAPKPKAKEEPAAKPAGKPTDAPAADTRIDCANEERCTIERELVEEVLANPAKLASQAPRVTPAPSGGYKVSGVKKGSLIAQLGVKSGDTILAVNGEALGGIDEMMGLVTKLRRASNLSVTIDRKGKSIEKNIEIRG